MDRGVAVLLRRSLARARGHRLTRALTGPRLDVVLATTFLAVGTLVGAVHVERVGQGSSTTCGSLLRFQWGLRYSSELGEHVSSDDARNDVRIESVTWGVVLDADREGRP